MLPPLSPKHRPARAKELEKKSLAVKSVCEWPTEANGRLVLKPTLRVLELPARETKLTVVK